MSENKPTTPSTENTRTRPVLAPPVDIFENPDEYLVLAELPGVLSDDVKVRFKDGELTIHATREDRGEGQVLGAEFTAADFVRRFSIPETVDTARIDARLQDGLLRLSLPKAERMKPRQIAVRAG